MISDGYHWQRPSYRRRRADSRLSFWIITALILSIAGHIVLWIVFGTFRVDQVAKIALTETFSIERSTFDANILENVPDTVTNQPNAADDSNGQTGNEPVSAEEISKFTEFNEADIPVDFIVNAEIKMTPAVEQMENIALDAAGVTETALANPSDASAGDPTADLSQMLKGLQDHQQPLDPNHPSINAGDLLGSLEETTLDPSSQAGGGGGGDLVPDGYASLDEVLGMKGRGDPGKPIWVPTDVLFQFNSAELREDARLSLMKLGALIMQRKDSEFILEGHTDLIGDGDYNLALSINRATAIRNWLLDALRLDPKRIRVKGLGKTKPLVLEGTPEEQAQNRRVEVTIQPLGTEGPF
ncbi:MAG: OOP family OmpA-OmpF porin [Verrucomicrobiales bacterium]|jgi:OOP family OmpA-OmpF porin